MTTTPYGIVPEGPGHTPPAPESPTDPPRGLASWFHTNRLGLLAALAIVSVTFFGFGYADWQTYYGVRPSSPIVVEVGETTEFAGATWGPATARWISDPEIPPGASGVQVAIPITTTEPFYCLPPTLTETTGEHRTWTSAYLPNSTAGFAADSCDSTAVDPYVLRVTYIVPNGASEPLAVDVSIIEQLPTFPRFLIDIE